LYNLTHERQSVQWEVSHSCFAFIPYDPVHEATNSTRVQFARFTAPQSAFSQVTSVAHTHCEHCASAVPAHKKTAITLTAVILEMKSMISSRLLGLGCTGLGSSARIYASDRKLSSQTDTIKKKTGGHLSACFQIVSLRLIVFHVHVDVQIASFFPQRRTVNFQ
jgi:hypothetical protein